MFGQWGGGGGRQQQSTATSSALRNSMGQFQSMGVNIATKYRPPESPTLSMRSPSKLPVSRFRTTAKAMGTQPFDLSGGRKGRVSPILPGASPADRFKHRAKQMGHSPFALTPAQIRAEEQRAPRGGDFFIKKAKQVGHQPFPLAGPAAAVSSGHSGNIADLFANKARQLGHQPFSLVIHPPSPVRQPGNRFKTKANQLAHQPFAMGRQFVPEPPKVVEARINYFKRKAKSIGFMAAQPLFQKTIEEQIKKHGRFKSFCKAITRTRRMLVTHAVTGKLEVIEEELNNEAEIKAGTYPMLKKEIIMRMFEYLNVADLKTARLVCEFWKRFATPSLQRKSMVNLTGQCSLCKSEWMSADPTIEPHEHTDTISFYRFVIFLLEYSSDRRYYLPYRNFRIMNLNLYFIAGLNTEPTRVFLMFLKIFAENVHHLHLQQVQLCPPNAFYKFLDCLKRLDSIVFDGICVWLDPLIEPGSEQGGFQMNINHYVRSITFVTNWVGEELLHWQMIFQAFPCLEELNLIDVSKTEINHCLAALINLPEDEEEEEEMRLTGGFKKLTRQIMLVPCDDDDEMDSEAEAYGPVTPRTFRQLTRLMINTPFNLHRQQKLEKVQQTNPGRFKKFARGMAFNPFPLTGLGKRRSLAAPAAQPALSHFKKFAKGLTRQPFALGGKPSPMGKPLAQLGLQGNQALRPIIQASMKGAARRFMIINQPFLMRKHKGGQVRVKELRNTDHQPSFKRTARKLQLLEQFFGQMGPDGMLSDPSRYQGQQQEQERQTSPLAKAAAALGGRVSPTAPKKEVAAVLKKSALSAWAAPPPTKPSAATGRKSPTAKDILAGKGKDSPSSGKDSPSSKKESSSKTDTKGGKETPDSKSDAKGKDSPLTLEKPAREKSASKSKERESSSKGTRESSSKGTRESSSKGTRESSSKGTRESSSKGTRESSSKGTRESSSKGKDSPSLMGAVKDAKDKERPSSKSSSRGKDSAGLMGALKDIKDKDKDSKDRPSSKSSSKGKDSPAAGLMGAVKDMKDKERPSSKSSSKGKDSPVGLMGAVKDMKDKDRPSSKSSSKGKDSPAAGLMGAVKDMKDKDRPSSKSSSKGKDSPAAGLMGAVKDMKEKERPSSKSSSKGTDSPSLKDAMKELKDKERPSSKSSSKGKDSPALGLMGAVKDMKEKDKDSKDRPSSKSSSKGVDSPALKDAVKDLKDKERPSSKSSSKGKDSPSLKDMVKKESSSSSKGKDSPALKDALKELKDKERPSSKSSSKGKDSPSLKDVVKKESSSSSKGKDSPALKDAVKDLKDKERPSSKSSSKGKDSPSLKDAIKSSSKGKDSPKLKDALSELKKEKKESSDGSSSDRKSSGKSSSKGSSLRDAVKKESRGKDSPKLKDALNELKGKDSDSGSDRKSSGKKEGSSSSDRKSSGKRESSSERKSSGKKESSSSSDRKSSGKSERKSSAKKGDSPSQIKSPSPIKEVPEPDKKVSPSVSPGGTRATSPTARGPSPGGGGMWGAQKISPQTSANAAARAFSPSGIPQRAVSPTKPPPSRMTGFLKKKAKAIMMQPFRLSSGIGIKGEKRKFDAKGRFKRRARLIINQPFTLVNSPPDDIEEERYEAMDMKSHIKKIVNQPFQLSKPDGAGEETVGAPVDQQEVDPSQPAKTPLEMFRDKVKMLRNQPFSFEKKARPKVLAGSKLFKINISCRRNFEDQLKLDLGLPDESDDTEDDSRYNDPFDGDGMDYYDEDESSDEESSIHETDFEHFDVNELLAEVVARFAITQLTLRVNYTRDDCVTFPIVLEACQEKVKILTLTRPPKIYFSELGMQFRTCPFETPEETNMEFPEITKLCIAHNLVDNIEEIRASFPNCRNLTINVVWTEFLVRNMKPYKTYVKTNLMLSMKHGKPIECVRHLKWNIQDARHPYTQKRTVVYKSNAIRHLPRVFPNLSKLSVSITTAHELHVIFRECSQLHDLIVLKNSFYRIKDEDIIGVEEESEDEGIEYEEEIEEEFRVKANRVRTLHPTRIKNGGIKQLRFLRRLALENNNYCLTNDSVEHGFLHLRRLRSLHISRGKRITMWALRLLRQCRFLVHVNVTKDKLKALRLPILADGEFEEPDLTNLTEYQKLQYKHYMSPNPTATAYQDAGIYITENVPGYEPPPPEEKVEYATTKYDKLGGKKFQYVTTSYEVNGRRYELVRRKYEYDNERDCKIWAKRVRLAELRRQKDEEAQALAELKRSQEVDPEAMIWRAEKKRESELHDQESDYERFINDYDSDESVEEGYCDADEDNDDDLPEKDRKMLDHGRTSESEWNDDEDSDNDEDGNCPEADTMYEADKEHYRDTNDDRSTGNESYCDSDFSRASDLYKERRRRTFRATGKHGSGSGSNSDADDSDDDYPPKYPKEHDSSSGPAETTTTALSANEQSENKENEKNSRRNSKANSVTNSKANSVANSKANSKANSQSNSIKSKSEYKSTTSSAITAGTKTSKQCKKIIEKLTGEIMSSIHNKAANTSTTGTTSSSGNFPADHSIITTSSNTTDSKGQLLQDKLTKSKKDKIKTKDATKKKDKESPTKNKKDKDSPTKNKKDKESPTKMKTKDPESPTKGKKDKKSKNKSKAKKDKKKKRFNSAGDADSKTNANPVHENEQQNQQQHQQQEQQPLLNENENPQMQAHFENVEHDFENETHSSHSDFNFKLQKLYRIGGKSNAIEINQDILANERVGIDYNEAMRRKSMTSTNSGQSQLPGQYYGHNSQGRFSTTSSDLGLPGQGMTWGFGATSSSGSYQNMNNINNYNRKLSQGSSIGSGSNSYSTSSSGYEGQVPHDKGHGQGHDRERDSIRVRGMTAQSSTSSYEDFHGPARRVAGHERDRRISGISDTTTSTSSGFDGGQFPMPQNHPGQGHCPRDHPRNIPSSTTSSVFEGQHQHQHQHPNRLVSAFSTTSSSYESQIPMPIHIQGPGRDNRGINYSVSSSIFEGQIPNRLTSAFSTTSSSYEVDDRQQNQHPDRGIIYHYPVPLPGQGQLPPPAQGRRPPPSFNSSSLSSSNSTSSTGYRGGHGTSFISTSSSSTTGSSQNLDQNRNFHPTMMPLDDLPSHINDPENLKIRKNRSQLKEAPQPILTRDSKRKLKSVEIDQQQQQQQQRQKQIISEQQQNQTGDRKRRKSEKEKDGRKSKNGKNKRSNRQERSKSREPDEPVDNERGKNCKSVGDNHVKAGKNKRDRSCSKPRLPDLKTSKEIENRLGDLRQTLISKMVKDVKKELRK